MIVTCGTIPKITEELCFCGTSMLITIDGQHCDPSDKGLVIDKCQLNTLTCSNNSTGCEISSPGCVCENIVAVAG